MIPAIRQSLTGLANEASRVGFPTLATLLTIFVHDLGRVLEFDALATLTSHLEALSEKLAVGSAERDLVLRALGAIDAGASTGAASVAWSAVNRDDPGVQYRAILRRYNEAANNAAIAYFAAATSDAQALERTTCFDKAEALLRSEIGLCLAKPTGCSLVQRLREEGGDRAAWNALVIADVERCLAGEFGALPEPPAKEPRPAAVVPVPEPVATVDRTMN